MTGSSIFDYVHQSDHMELAEQLGVRLAYQQKLSSNEDKCDSNHNSGGSPAIPDGIFSILWTKLGKNQLYSSVLSCYISNACQNGPYIW